MKNAKSFWAFTNQRNPASWLVEFFNGEKSKTGIKVNTKSALGLAAVIYAVNKISGHISQLPFNVYEESDGQRELKNQNPAYRLLNVSPNQAMTAFTLREIMMVHALISGNGRAYIARNNLGTPVELIPILPENCQTMLVDGEKWHLVTAHEGTTQNTLPIKLRQGEYYKIPDRDVLHIMNTSMNGVWGMHVVEIAKDVFGLAQAGQEAAATTLANSGRPSLLLEAPVGMFRSAKDSQEFLDNFNKKHAGVEASGRAGLLRDGMKATTLPISATDAQFLEQRAFQREEIALLFGLESILGDNTGQTYRSISERNTAYVNNCLQRWMCKWEEEVMSKLISPARPLEVEFDTTPLLKGDPNSLADYTMKMQQHGVLTINEIRQMHGFSPVDDGDKLPHQIALDISQATQPEEEEQEQDVDQEEQVEAALSIDIVAAKYDHIDFSPPEAVQKEAAKGLEWRKKYGRGGTEVGVARARDLSNGKNISPETAKRMKSYFARHEVDKQAEGWSPGEEGYPSAGRIAWALWSGNPGRSWSNKLVEQIEAADEKDS